MTEMEEQGNDISIGTVAQQSLLLSVSGSAHHDVRIGNTALQSPTPPGAVALIPAGIDLHSSWRTSGGALRTFTLEFDSDLFLQHAPEICSPRFHTGQLVSMNYGDRPTLASIAQMLRREMDDATRHGSLFLDGLIRLLVLELAGSAWSVPARMPDRTPVGEDKRVLKAIDFIEAHALEDISLNDIATASVLSPNRLSTLFRRHTGMAPYSYVIERRIEAAVGLLRSSDMPIAQVAIETGFADQQHLTRVFRARKGSTPGRVRQAP